MAHEVGRIIAPALGSIPCNYLGLGEPFSFPVTVIGYPAVLAMLRIIRPPATSFAGRDAWYARYTQQQQPGGPSSFGADGTVLSMSLRNHDEANVPTQQPEAEEDARVQDQDANPGRPPHPGPAPRQGPGEHLGLSAGQFVEDRQASVAPSTAHMAPSPNLRRDADFRHVVHTGRPFSGRLVTVYRIPTEGHGRTGFVTRREIGGAVLRNRARRVLREAWREVAPLLSRPVDAVVVARPAIVGAKTGEVAAEIRALLSRDGLIAG